MVLANFLTQIKMPRPKMSEDAHIQEGVGEAADEIAIAAAHESTDCVAPDEIVAVNAQIRRAEEEALRRFSNV